MTIKTNNKIEEQIYNKTKFLTKRMQNMLKNKTKKTAMIESRNKTKVQKYKSRCTCRS